MANDGSGKADFRKRPTRLGAARVSILAACWLIALVWNGTVAVRAASSDRLSVQFDAANTLYGQGKFTEAAAAYQKLIQDGFISPAIFFNLGNAWFKSTQMGRAVAAYREAERLAPRDPDVSANLQFIRNQIQGPTLTPDRWQRWIGRLTLDEWTLLAVVVLWLWLCLLVLVQIRPNLKTALRNVLILGAAATVCLGVVLALVLREDSRSIVVVASPKAVVHNGPLDESPEAFVVHDGAELRVLDRKESWLQVTAGSRRLGWIKQSDTVEPRSLASLQGSGAKR